MMERLETKVLVVVYLAAVVVLAMDMVFWRVG